MTIYIVLLSLLFLLSFFHLNRENTFFNPIWYAILIFLILFIGLRDGIGGDWVTYENFFEFYKDSNFQINFTTEPFFYNFYIILGRLNFNIFMANLLSAIFFIYSLSLFLKKEKYPFYSLYLAFPVLIVVISMGFNRQAIAISFLMIGYIYWQKFQVRFLLLVIISALFHKSAIIILLINKYKINFKKNVLTLLFLVIFLSIIYLYINRHINNIVRAYPLFEFNNLPSYLRITYIIYPSLIFMFFRNSFKQFNDYYFLKKFSLFALLLIPIMIANVDVANRLGFYYLPVSVIILSRFPYIFSIAYFRYSIFLFINLLTYTYFIFFLYYANNINGWVPYKNLLTQ